MACNCENCKRTSLPGSGYMPCKNPGVSPGCNGRLNKFEAGLSASLVVIVVIVLLALVGVAATFVFPVDFNGQEYGWWSAFKIRLFLGVNLLGLLVGAWWLLGLWGDVYRRIYSRHGRA